MLRRARGWLGLGVTMLAAVAPAMAAPSLVAAPAELTLCAGRERLVRVSLTEGPFKVPPTLQAVSDSGVQALAERVGTATKDSATWLVRVSLPAEGAVPVAGTLHLTALGEGTPPLAVSVVLKSPDPAAAFPARLELQGAAETLPESVTQRLPVVVANSGAAPLRLNRLEAVDGGHPFVVAAPKPPPPGTVVPAGGMLVVPFEVSVGASTPAPGKHRLLFRADLSGEFDGCPRQASLVAGRDLGFQVIGESAVLTALAVPSFLLVPGALCLLVPAVLWRFGLRLPGHAKEDRFPLGPGTPEFWTLAITLSIVGFGLLLFFGLRSDLLVAYRLRDLVVIWFGSAVVGLAWYLPTRAYQLRREAAAQAQLAALQWKAAQPPLEVLRRLAARGARLQQNLQPLDPAKLGLGQGPAALFELEAGAERVWLCGFIEIDAEDAPDAVQDQLVTARDSQDAAQLLQVLALPEADGVRLAWAPAGAWPVAVDAAAYAAARQGAAGGPRRLEALVRGA